MTILLVRHGETDGNAARILQRPDVPLNERGTRQAEQLAGRLSAFGFVCILCSDYLRARMTAAPLAARSGIAIEESPLLRERNFGDLRGMPYAQLIRSVWARLRATQRRRLADISCARRRCIRLHREQASQRERHAGGGHAWFRLPCPRRATCPVARRRHCSRALRQCGHDRAARTCAARGELDELHTASRVK